MTLAERLSELVRAAFSGIYVVIREHDDAVAEVAELCRAEGWAPAAWDAGRGLEAPGRPAEPGAADPLAAALALAALATPDGTAILVLRNFHRYMGSPEVAQALETRLSAGMRERTFVVIPAPLVQLPPELEAQFVVVEHEPPGRAQLEAIARGVAPEPGELPGGDGLEAVLDAAAGLARAEAEGAFALSLVRRGRLLAAPLWEIKAGMLRKSGLLALHRGGASFAELGGLDALKAFRAHLRPGQPAGVRARGVLLLGPPGSGKSQFAKGAPFNG